MSRTDPYVRALREAVKRSIPEREVMSVGRDGASDAVAFMAAGIPAVEFGPAGGGHHGPDEWVSVSSLARYRRALRGFVRSLAAHLGLEDAPVLSGEEGESGPVLKAIEGGRG